MIPPAGEVAGAKAMYVLSVGLFMLVLPLASIAVEVAALGAGRALCLHAVLR